MLHARFARLAQLVVVSSLGLGCLAGSSQAALLRPPEPPPSNSGAVPPGEKPKPMVLDRSVEAMLAERIARQLVAASPQADPADPKARDAAAEKLAACTDLIEAANGRILWGGFHPDQGYDPAAYRLTSLSPTDYYQLTELNPAVWAKLYLSTFMFPGPYQIRQEGRFTVLEIDAKFRGGLDPGEYPYPFWHSPVKWTLYMNAEKVLFIFEPGRLLASMRKSPQPLALNLIRRQWDTKWTWTDKNGDPQPRVALFSYLFSSDNPHVQQLDKSYRSLEKEFRELDCTACHEPDNRSRINDLLLLNYPNQALIMRRSLVTVLEENQMPPGNKVAHEPKGIPDEEARQRLLKLARAFEKQADKALAFERLRTMEKAETASPD